MRFEDHYSVVIDTGPGIPGGYMDRGTTDTDTDTYFGIRHPTHTHIRHYPYKHDGYGLVMCGELLCQKR